MGSRFRIDAYLTITNAVNDRQRMFDVKKVKQKIRNCFHFGQLVRLG